MMNNEAEMVKKAIMGDETSLTDLICLVDPPIRTRLQAKIKPAHRSLLDATDILQVTYIEVYLRIAQFENRGDGAFLAWVTRMAENNLRDAEKMLNAKKRPTPALRATNAGQSNDSYIAMVNTLSSPGTTPTNAARGAEAKSAIDTALGQMPKDYTKVIQLYDLDQLHINDVAENMGRSSGAIHMLRARAHDRLRELLGSEGNFFTI